MFIFLTGGKCVISAPSLKTILVDDDEVDQTKRSNEVLRSRDWEILRKKYWPITDETPTSPCRMPAEIVNESPGNDPAVKLMKVA